jgi:hypothetical protein
MDRFVRSFKGTTILLKPPLLGAQSKPTQERTEDVTLFSDPLVEVETQYGPFDKLRARCGRHRQAYRHGYIDRDTYLRMLEDDLAQAKRWYHSDYHVKREICRVEKSTTLQFHITPAPAFIPPEYRKTVDTSSTIAAFLRTPASGVIAPEVKVQAFLHTLGVSQHHYAEELMARARRHERVDVMEKVMSNGPPVDATPVSITVTTTEAPSSPPDNPIGLTNTIPPSTSDHASQVPKSIAPDPLDSPKRSISIVLFVSFPYVIKLATGNAALATRDQLVDYSPVLVSRPRIRAVPAT